MQPLQQTARKLNLKKSWLCVAAIVWLALATCFIWHSLASNGSDSVAENGSTAKEGQELALKVQVVSEINDKGQQVTEVRIDQGIGMSPVFAGILISMASVYLMVLIVYICRKRCSEEEESVQDSDETYATSLDYVSESTEVFNESATSVTASSAVSRSELSRPKDTMSNSSID